MRGLFLRFLIPASLLIGLFPSTLTSQPTTATRPSAEEARAQKTWRTAMARVPLPKKGCFHSAYPSLQWSEIQCVTPPPYPQVPRRGPRPLVGGGGNDVAAQAPSGTISSATGSFDTVTNVTSEAGQLGGLGGQVTDAYTYQLNTNTFFGSPACDNAADKTVCQGWEQFIFANDGTTGNAYIQYWLISYNKPCPGGWAPYTYPGPTDTSCYKNSTFGAPLPSQTISNMLQTTLTGTVSATSDSVNFIGGGQSYAMGDNSVNAATGWNIAEFAVVGNGNGGQANFNGGASYVSRTTIAYGGTSPPICKATGFTGETNNLSFGPGAPVATGSGPALIFTESTAGGATANCLAATSIGDTHLTTVKGLLYDFQASGDFVVAQLDPDFAVQARQVNGAPTWPNATLNKAIATRMGKSTVALCLAPERLLVDGKVTGIPQSGVLELPDGVDITLRRKVYYITSPSGDSVRATVNPGWIDMSIGFGHWPATVKGLLANANDDINQLAASDGTVLTNAFPFNDLYHHYADSWRVSPSTSLLSACGGETQSGAPSATFYAADLDPQVREHSRAVCATAGVTDPAFLDACTADVAMTGKNEAATVFAGMPPPAAVGKIAGGAASTSGSYGRYIWWLLLLLILILIIVWLILRKR